jgi:hypothetical protein
MGATQKTGTGAKLGYKKKKMKSNHRVQKQENEPTTITKSNLHTINFMPRFKIKHRE